MKKPPSRDQLLSDLHRVVEELADPHQVTTPIWDWTAKRNKRMSRSYTVRVDGLLTQLLEAVPEARSAVEGSSRRPTPDSRPPGSWEALSTHCVVVLGVTRWVHQLCLELRDTVESNLYALIGAAPGLSYDQLADLAADAADWHHRASVALGWRSPAARFPGVPCPRCGQVNTLRINPERMVGRCTNEKRNPDDTLVCGARWDTESIGVLGEYIKTINEAKMEVPA